jgi:aryl-alcohol dehydrogenase-like predicted oxidoreductase
VGLIPWSPLGGGLLGGVLRDAGNGRRARPRLQAQIERYRPQLDAYEARCAQLGEKPADVALAWLLANPAVTATIIGPRTSGQVQASLRAPDIGLPGEVLSALDEIWPGPGGEAPQAYAW